MDEISTNMQIKNLQHQLAVARNEINNLRQQVKSVTYANQKEIKKIEDMLNTWECKKCNRNRDLLGESKNPIKNVSDPDELLLQPIGIISTDFSQKKGVPRQPGIGCHFNGKISLNNNVFTNPEHALEGLKEFSHMWILFHFHRNASNHVKAKVTPPRLNGIRMGVFATRSPHRPNPIGLSLVQISHIDDASIYFSGVDMVDGTPVLDLKPYIPSYDNPLMQSIHSEPYLVVDHEQNLGLLHNEEGGSRCLEKCFKNFGEREAPDGEESNDENASLPVSSVGCRAFPIVRVPEWVLNPPVPSLEVTFSHDLVQLDFNSKELIKSILREDPRSIYLRERYGNKFYTFLIQDFHVSCKFDDSSQTVNVYRVTSAGKPCSCGIPQWQCTVHHLE